jgi:hypothetical protein
MPFRDRTGPLGQGPMTGRGRGFCGGFAAPGNMNPGRGMGRGGRGWGMGWRNQFWATGLRSWQRTADWLASNASGRTTAPSLDPLGEIAALKGQEESLRSALNQVQKRVEELDKKLAHSAYSQREAGQVS